MLLGLALAPVAYQFEPGVTQRYDVTVKFEGFLPVLGGNEGVVDVAMGVKVLGGGAKEQNLKATNELTAFEIKFNEAKLPLTLENAVDYFPLTNITVSPLGQIVANDAPDKVLPVRLPGLDVKRFPDITYVPIVLPSEGIETGRSWTFKRSFGGSDLNYTCTAKNVTEAQAQIEVKIAQEYETLENEALEVVAKEADAVSRVKTTMTGQGEVLFDLKVGAPNKVVMVNSAVSTVTPLKGGESKTRSLKSTLNLKRQGAPTASTAAKPAPAKAATWQDAAVGLWNKAVAGGKQFWASANGYWTLLQLAFATGFQGLPLPGVFGFKK